MNQRRFLRQCCLIAAIATICAANSFAGDVSVPHGYSLVRTERDISEFRLDANGLTVLLLPDHSVPAVTLMVTYRVGSRNESYGTTGATHLLEHLMFKGTAEHNKEAGTGFDQLLERAVPTRMPPPIWTGRIITKQLVRKISRWPSLWRPIACAIRACGKTTVAPK